MLSHAKYRAEFEHAAHNPPPYPANASYGRGIVICAGGPHLENGLRLIRRLRAVGCTLPIEVWGLPGEDLEAFDGLAEMHVGECAGGWQLKPHAIVHCAFRDVLLLDADNLPTRNPAFLLSCDEFLRCGAIFWPFIEPLPAWVPIWEMCGVSSEPPCSFESGQIAVDKSRCWAPLNLALHMNERSDFYYKVIYGDKDTFLVAWRKLGVPFALAPACDHDKDGIYQKDFEGRILFEHRCN